MEVAVRRTWVLLVVVLLATLDAGALPADELAAVQPPTKPTTPAKPGQDTGKPPPSTPAPPTRPPQTTPLGDQSALAAPTTGRLDISQAPEVTQIVMLGDQIGIPGIAFGMRGIPGFPPFPGAIKGAILVPSIRSFKVSEDEAPLPQDRVYFGFNYWDNLNAAVNRAFGSDLTNMNAYRETFGVEKTFLKGDASIGLRLPLNTLSADSGVPGLAGTSTDIGDLTVILKLALLRDQQTGNGLSLGLAITTPTGPSTFAGFQNVVQEHETTLQPFIGYVYHWDNFFVHGFTSIEVPTRIDDVTILYNDVGIGYYVYRNRCQDALISAVVPTFEVHVNTPLNHRGALNFNDIAGTADVVDLTTGATFELGRRATFAAAFVVPVTGPKPYDFEVLAQLNIRFGARGCGGRSTNGGARMLE
jgi:hypothetical protein